jgi:uncharacterized protein (DUF2336 family)
VTNLVYPDQAMKAVADLIADIDRTIASGTPVERALSRTTDLLLGGGISQPEQLAVLDAVMRRFAGASGIAGRTELARRIAGSQVPLPELLRVLAHDEAIVAAPILQHATGLAEGDLMAVALAKGRDHLLAICARHELDERVTDLLVLRADPLVNCAVAGNNGARFSDASLSTLIDRSRADVRLQDLLGARGDLSDDQTQALVAATRESARHNLVETLSSRHGVVPFPAVSPIGGGPPKLNPVALAAMAQLARTGFLTEQQLKAFATEGRYDETIAAVVQMSGLPMDYVARLFAQRDNDLLLVIGRSRDWSWDTMLAVLRVRDPALANTPQLWRVKELFRGMQAATARQTLEFIKMRQALVPPPIETPKLRLFKRA